MTNDAQASQSNTDQNQNQGGYIGEVEASLGKLDLFGNNRFGGADSSASASGSSSLTIGATEVLSGASNSGRIGIVKMGLLAVVGLIAYSVIFKKKGK